METLKKFGYFFALCFVLVGVLGGIGSALYMHSYFIAFCVAFVAWMAYPRIKQFIDNLLGE